MDSINWEKVETIIDQALDLPEEKREQFINNQCGTNQQLKGEVTLLLDSIFDSEGWLEDPQDYKKEFYEEITDDVDLISADQSLIGKTVGAYTIREKIGEGGMGTVYRAQRSDGAFDHQVAIKIIRRGRATDHNIRRFRREQRILAGLNHPGIAKLFDGSITSDGFPYIIMEYVDGTPIDDYCKANSYSIDEKITLFEQVLEAIRYAHESLVIHRDLKPVNILVDESGKVKILDFGISKLLEDEGDSALTHTGARLLTPRYAAPEQIRQENITTATDLYALGIIFYELIAGMGPFEFGTRSQYEIEQTILKHEAPKPSNKVNDPAIQKQPTGDLDAIALKAIRKEPEQRYRVANEFLDDLKHYQTGLPVSACEDSFRYRSGKFFKRNNKAVLTIIGLLILIIGFAGFYTWSITQERNQAKEEAKKARNITDFLLGIFEANYPENNRGEEITARALLQAGRKNASEIQDLPVKAEMLQVIGKAYFKIGFRDSALAVFENSRSIIEDLYGEKSQQYATNSYNIGATYESYADLALPYFKDSFEIRSELLGISDPSSVQSMLKIGQSYRYLNQLDSAEYYVTKSIENFRENSLSTDKLYLKAKDAMASIYIQKGDFGKAEQYYLDIIDAFKKGNEIDSLELSELYQDLAWTYIPRKKFAEALPYLKQSLKIAESIYGKGHSITLRARNDLAGVNRDLGNLNAFQAYSESNIKYATEHYGIGHRITCMANSAYGVQLTIEKLYSKGENFLKDGLKSCTKAFGKKHIWTAVLESTLAANLEASGQVEKSKLYFQDSYKILEDNARKFNRVNRNQIEIIIQLYKNAQHPNQKRINDYSRLIAPT